MLMINFVKWVSLLIAPKTDKELIDDIFISAYETKSLRERLIWLSDSFYFAISLRVQSVSIFLQKTFTKEREVFTNLSMPKTSVVIARYRPILLSGALVAVSIIGTSFFHGLGESSSLYRIQNLALQKENARLQSTLQNALSGEFLAGNNPNDPDGNGDASNNTPFPSIKITGTTEGVLNGYFEGAAFFLKEDNQSLLIGETDSAIRDFLRNNTVVAIKNMEGENFSFQNQMVSKKLVFWFCPDDKNPSEYPFILFDLNDTTTLSDISHENILGASEDFNSIIEVCR